MVVPPDGDTPTPIDIENLDLNAFMNYYEDEKQINFFYSKEEIAKLGISLEELEALECFTFDNFNPTENNSILIDDSIIINGFIITGLTPMFDNSGLTDVSVKKMSYTLNYKYIVMRYAYGDNNNYIITSIEDSN